MLPKPIWLWHPFLRGSHGTNAYGETLWGKWWSNLFWLISLTIRFYNDSLWWYYSTHEEVALQRFAWYCFTQWELLNNSICDRHGNVLPRSFSGKDLLLCCCEQFPATISCWVCLSCRATLPKVTLPEAAQTSDQARQRSKGPAISA